MHLWFQFWFFFLSILLKIELGISCILIVFHLSKFTVWNPVTFYDMFIDFSFPTIEPNLQLQDTLEQPGVLGIDGWGCLKQNSFSIKDLLCSSLSMEIKTNWLIVVECGFSVFQITTSGIFNETCFMHIQVQNKKILLSVPAWKL